MRATSSRSKRHYADPLPEQPPVPGWVRAIRSPDLAQDCAAHAGAVLALLHPVATSAHPMGQLWRRRLALVCAQAIARQQGRRESEAELRDQWMMRRTGEDPGPAGRIVATWRALADRQAIRVDHRAAKLPELFDLSPEDTAGFLRAAEPESRNPIRAVAGTVAALATQNPALALWLGDALLAERLGWHAPVPILAAHLRLRDMQEPEQAVALALARGGLAALDLHADLVRKANRMLAVAPKLRGKDAGAIVMALLTEDAVAARAGENASDRAARRAFDRLTALGVVRELTGRPTFRFYGL